MVTLVLASELPGKTKCITVNKHSCLFSIIF